MMIRHQTQRRQSGLSSIGSTAYTNVNDHLYLGKTAEEIARMHAEFQGIPYEQAIRDSSIRLFTDPEYRESVTTPLPKSDIQTATIQWINPDTGATERINRASGRVSQADAEALARRLGGTVVLAPRAFGADWDDYSIVMPSGLKVPAAEIAQAVNSAQTPEAAYNYITQLQAITSASSPAVRAEIITQRALDAMRTRSIPSAVTPTAPSGSTATSATRANAGTGINTSTNNGLLSQPRGSGTLPGESGGLASWFSNIFGGEVVQPENALAENGVITAGPDNAFGSLFDSPLLLIGAAAVVFFLVKGK